MKTPLVVERQDSILPVQNQLFISGSPGMSTGNHLNRPDLAYRIDKCSRTINLLQLVVRACPNNRLNSYYVRRIGELCDLRAELQVELEYILEKGADHES